MIDTTLSVYRLANMAGCSTPDDVNSPGAEWLLSILTDVNELVEDNPSLSAYDLYDDISERADSIVPTYTHELWKVFTDLAAYQEEIDGVYWDRADDITGLAGIALVQIAERLYNVLIDSQKGDTHE